MHTILRNAQLMMGLLALSGTLHGVPPRHTTPHRSPHTPPQGLLSQDSMLVIRVSQESSPEAGDFDPHVLGSITALHTTDSASQFWEEYKRQGVQRIGYFNTEPALTAKTSHFFFVHAADGLALFIVNGKPDLTVAVSKGWPYRVDTRWTLSGGKAHILYPQEGVGCRANADGSCGASADGTVFEGRFNWASDGVATGTVVGPLPAGFTMLGQFIELDGGWKTDKTEPLSGGWVALSADGSRIPLSPVIGQRVRLTVVPGVSVHPHH